MSSISSISSNRAMEPCNKDSDQSVDSTKHVTVNDSRAFDCCVCLQLLTIPVFQCKNGHIVCSTCCDKLGKKCDKCSKQSLTRCKEYADLFQSIKLPCPNEKYGCRETIRYSGKRKHGEECIYVPCYCPPLSGCDLVASLEVLSNHFNREHCDSLIEFSYGHPFTVSLKSSDVTVVLQEEHDGRLFTLNNSTITRMGNAVNISCIDPKSSSEVGYSYHISARSEFGSLLKLHASPENVQQATLPIHSSVFLLIPFGHFSFSEPLKLEICITPKLKKQR